MKVKSRSITVFLAILAAAPIFFLSPMSSAQVDEGQIAPDFTLWNLKGKEVSLADFKGKIVVLDFWATWCLPCRKSLPELAELEKKYRGKGVVFLGLSLDDPDSYDNKYVAEFKDSYKVEYQILRATPGMVASYLGTEGVKIPAFVILDKKGKVVKIHSGYERGIVEGTLQQMLSAP